MGFGRGKGKGNGGAIYCAVCLLLVGLTLLGLGIALIRVGAGDYDDQVIRDNDICGEDISFDDVLNNRNREDYDCSDWEDWDNEKDIMRNIGIALLLVAVFILFAAIVMLMLMCITICGSRNQSNNSQCIVLSQPNQGGYPQQGYAQQGYPQQNQGYTEESYEVIIVTNLE